MINKRVVFFFRQISNRKDAFMTSLADQTFKNCVFSKFIKMSCFGGHEVNKCDMPANEIEFKEIQSKLNYK